MQHRAEHVFTDEVCQPFLLAGEQATGKRHGVLLLHGFTGSVAHMRKLADALHAQGFTVMGINLPGHATSMDDMAAQNWQDWLEAAKAAFLQLKAQCDYVSVAGLSMGGCLALILAEQMQPTAVVPISAPMGTRAPLWLASLASPVLKTVWWKVRAGNTDPVDARYDIGYPGFRSTCAAHLSRLMRMAQRDLHAVTCPILIVQSHSDATITADSADTILKGVSSKRKGILWLKNAPHVCTISQDVGQIAAAAAEHVRWAENN